MTIAANSPDEYASLVPDIHQPYFNQLREVLKNNLHADFAEEMSYNMPSFVVPKAIYPKGYHCKPFPALPFISIASQKNFIALYHMGIYAVPSLLEWFVAEWPKHTDAKLDMGKSCIRLTKYDKIPYELIGQLAQKMSAQEWIEVYESVFIKLKVKS
jgi:hypothetical protein